MRKKVRIVAVRTPPHVVDRRARYADGIELNANQCREVAVGFLSRFAFDRRRPADPLELRSDFFTNLERGDPDVGAHRDEDLGGGMRERTKRVRDDARHCASPTYVNRSDVAARRMRDQQGNAVGRAHCQGHAFVTSDERVALLVHGAVPITASRDDTHSDPMNLPLLEETIGRHAEVACKPFPVLEHGRIVITEMKTKVERVVGSLAYPASSGRERMTKPMLV